MNKGQKIDGIVPGSIAEELGLEPEDIIITINGEIVSDVLDYRFLCKDEYLDILVRRGDEEAIFEVEKDAEEELGIIFNDGLMDEYHSCCNRCIFCFIDQMPPGMRDTLYFKDDDERLSFLQGNYITLTSLSEEDLDRIIRYRLSPINISVQTTNKDLRCKMLGNRFAGDALTKIDKLYEAGIVMNAQIVMCEGINDGEELEKTISDLSKYAPLLESLSVVPVGLTKYREGLYDLKPVSVDNAFRTIDIIESWQKRVYEKTGLHFVHASDEFYLMCNKDMPEADRYDGYLQYENGVGMLRLLEDEFDEAYDLFKESLKSNDSAVDTLPITIATGELAAPLITKLVDKFKNLMPKADVEVVPIKNEFFGRGVTVSGLITGDDIISQLKGRVSGRRLLITSNMLRSGENVFLDDITTDEIEEQLDVKICPVPNEGDALLQALIGENPSTITYCSYER